MSVTPSASHCRKCQAPLQNGGTDGFCTRCLFLPLARPLTAVGSGRDQTPTGEDAPEPRAFGDYEIVRKIARGGMGVVYQAHDPKANRTVALKMVLGGHFASETERKRFRTEAEAVASLDHPHIVPLYEVGEADRHPFFTMKFIEGGSLADKLGRTREPLAQKASARLIAKVAHAVHHAHQRGILHRDLKPANILLDAQGEPFVTDFGIARKLEGGSDLTHTGAVIGTPNYMAPEQAAGKSRAITTAADIYSLGAILYHLLTGRPPFAAPSPLETMRRVLDTEPVRPSVLQTQTDRDLETICLKCLEKEPSRRYESAAALAEDLERWLRHETIVARPAPPRERVLKWMRRKPLVASLAGLFVLAVAAGISGVFFQWRQAEAARRVAEAQTFRTEEASRHTEAMRTRAELEKADLQLRAGNSAGGLAGFAQVLRREPTNEIAAARLLSFLERQAVALPETLVPGGAGRAMDFALGPDQRYAAMTVDDETNNVRLVSLESGHAAPPAMTHPLELVVMRSNSLPGSGPGGRGFAPPFAGRRPPGAGPDAGMPGDMMRRLAPPENMVPIRVQFGPDGRRVITGSNSGEVRVWNTADGQPVTPFLEQSGVVLDLALTPDGQTALAVDLSGAVNLWSLPSGEPVRTLETGRRLALAQFSPDASQLLTISFANTAQIWDFAAGESLTDGIEMDTPRAAAWSPDGKTAAIATETAAYLLRANPFTVKKLLHSAPVNAVALSPDGKMAVTGSEDQAARVWDAVTGELRLTLPHPEAVTAVAFSHDGRQLAIIARDQSVRLWETATGRSLCEPLLQPAAPMSVHFTPDDRAVLVLNRDGSLRRHTLVTPPNTITFEINSAAQPDPVLSPPPGNASPPVTAVSSPDGKTVLRFFSIARGASLHDAATGERIGAFMRHGEKVNGGAFSPDGTKVITASSDATARLWDARTARPLSDPLRHEGAVLFAAFSPDGRLAVTASQDKTARLWKTEGAVTLQQTLRHAAAVRFAEFSRDGRRLLTVAADQTVSLWEVRQGLPLASPLLLSGKVTAAHFSPDGQLILMQDESGRTQRWAVPSLPPSAPPWLPDLAEIIGGQSLDANGLAQPAPHHLLPGIQAVLQEKSSREFYATNLAWLFPRPQ